jgi:hypothetical protein
MKTYLQLRDGTKAAYLAHHETIWERMGFTSAWGHLRDEETFNQVHAAVVRAVAQHAAQHGPFDTSLRYGDSVWQVDRDAAIRAIATAILAIAITLLCPPLAIIASFMADAIVAVILLTLASMAVDFATAALAGASPQQHAAQLNQWAEQAEG